MWKVSGFSRFERKVLVHLPRPPILGHFPWKILWIFWTIETKVSNQCKLWMNTSKYKFKTIPFHSLMLHWMRWCWGCVILLLKGTRSMSRTWSRYPVSMIYLIWRGGVMIALRKDNIDLVSGSPARGALNACHFGFCLPSLCEEHNAMEKGINQIKINTFIRKCESLAPTSGWIFFFFNQGWVKIWISFKFLQYQPIGLFLPGYPVQECDMMFMDNGGRAKFGTYLDHW